MKAKILDLRPTQMAIGIAEVDYRLKKIRKMKSKELEEYLHERRVPVILARDSRTYIIDHHHLARSCWEAGIEAVPIEIKADLSHLSYEELWKNLHSLHWIYPFDQFGNGPYQAIHLPLSIRGLADDPFRSLAWMVRESGGYDKNTAPFSEFHWADFFRKKLQTHPVAEDFDKALKEALQLASQNEASHLPGFKKK